jgi:hypothetical protein
MRIRLAYRRPMHLRLTSLLPPTAGRVRTHTSDPADESSDTRREDT